MVNRGETKSSNIDNNVYILNRPIN